MAKQFHIFEISVGLGLTPTYVMNSPTNVMTENDGCRLLLSFPSVYSEYIKSIDIGYTSVDDVATVESYDLSYDDESEHFYFDIDRKFTYHQRVNIQFRARYADGQDVVDPTILTLIFRNAIKTTNLEIIDANPTDQQTVILQNMVDAHSHVVASNTTHGHVALDNVTIKTNPSGDIYAVIPPQTLPKVDNITIFINSSSELYAVSDTKVDNETIFFNSSSELYSVPKVDNATIFLNAQGQLVGESVGKLYWYDEPICMEIPGEENLGLGEWNDRTNSEPDTRYKDVYIGDDGEIYIARNSGGLTEATGLYSNKFPITSHNNIAIFSSSITYIDSMFPDQNFNDSGDIYVWDDMYVGTGKSNDLVVSYGELITNKTHIIYSDDEVEAVYHTVITGSTYITYLVKESTPTASHIRARLSGDGVLYCFFETGGASYMGTFNGSIWNTILLPDMYSGGFLTSAFAIDHRGVAHVVYLYSNSSVSTSVMYFNNELGSFDTLNAVEVLNIPETIGYVDGLDICVDSNDYIHISVARIYGEPKLYYSNNKLGAWNTGIISLDIGFYTKTSIDAGFDSTVVIGVATGDSAKMCNLSAWVKMDGVWFNRDVSNANNAFCECDVESDAYGGVHMVYSIDGGYTYWASLRGDEWVNEAVVLSKYGAAHISFDDVYPEISYYNGRRINSIIMKGD